MPTAEEGEEDTDGGDAGDTAAAPVRTVTARHVVCHLPTTVVKLTVFP